MRRERVPWWVFAAICAASLSYAFLLSCGAPLRRW